jgi:o-succinylbenzoate---CoA ligase
MSGRPLHALLLPPGRQVYDALAAALDGGAAVLPLAPDLPPASLQRLLAELRPHLLISADGEVPLPDPAPVDDDVAVVVATSGSTGNPKGVQLTAAALRYSAGATLDRLDARSPDRWLSCLPTGHVAGVQVLVRSLVAGAEPEIHDRFDPAAVARSGAEFVALVPTMLGRLLHSGVDLRRFRTVLLGGAAVPPDLLARARRAGARVVTTYGMSETCGGCVYDGRPLTGVRVDLDADGRIRLGGPVLASGYRLSPELTAAAFRDGWFRTSDLGRFGPDGRLEVLGRADDFIVTGGENVAPRAVETLLGRHPQVREVVVVGRPDEEWGQRVTAVVVPANASRPPTLAELRSFVLAHAADSLAPRELVLVPSLPLLPSGKVDRRTLTGTARGTAAPIL